MWSMVGTEYEGARMPTRLTALDMELGGTTRLVGGRGCVSDFGLVRVSFVAVVGRPGVGKSSVLWEVIRNVSADCASVLCVSETLRVTAEVRATVTVRSSSSRMASTAKIEKELTKRPRHVLVLDDLAAVQVDGPLPRMPRGSTRADRQMKAVCDWAHRISRERRMCVIASARVDKAGRVSGQLIHASDAVVQLGGEANNVGFCALKNRFAKVLSRAA